MAHLTRNDRGVMHVLLQLARRRSFMFWLIAGLLGGCGMHSIAATPVDVRAEYPHDSGAFTQGLLYYDGALFESTGQYGESELRRVDIASGRVVARRRLASRYFGEGLARVANRLYQLTWKSGTGFIYNAATLERVGQFQYPGQGWGLTWDGQHFIMSDGSATLRVLDRQSFERVGVIDVYFNGEPLGQLNELEYVNGLVWANLWHDDRIVKIDPATGQVVDVINAHPLRRRLADSDAGVLNGIAFDDQTRRIFVTGKNWPWLFELDTPQGVSSPDSPSHQ